MEKYKNEKGGISIYVLVSMFLLTIILMGIYISVTNKHITQLEIAGQIKSTYEQDINNVDAVYNELMGITDSENSEFATIINNLSARVATLENQIYPVGSIYISVSATNPSEIFGGTWESYGEGRTLIGAGSGTDANNETVDFAEGSTGGEYRHTLLVEEMPSHNHQSGTEALYNNFGGGIYVGQRTWWTSNTMYSAYSQANTSTTGNSQPHNNLQPYIVTYMWKRIS